MLFLTLLIHFYRRRTYSQTYSILSCLYHCCIYREVISAYKRSVGEEEVEEEGATEAATDEPDVCADAGTAAATAVECPICFELCSLKKLVKLTLIYYRSVLLCSTLCWPNFFKSVIYLYIYLCVCVSFCNCLGKKPQNNAVSARMWCISIAFRSVILLFSS